MRGVFFVRTKIDIWYWNITAHVRYEPSKLPTVYRRAFPSLCVAYQKHKKKNEFHFHEKNIFLPYLLFTCKWTQPQSYQLL